jgi:regulator of sirC expression with transglutaminase-like and TPR domain
LRFVLARFFLTTFLFPICVFGSALSARYSTLDPTSVAQHFAFYELYPESAEGKAALTHAWALLSGECGAPCNPGMSFPTLDARPIISLMNRSSQSGPILEEHQLDVIERLAQQLPNRKLKGHSVWSREDLLALNPEEIDLARGLLIADFGETAEDRLKIRSYEATLDLMALQILARLPPEATSLDKVRTINDYIFSELRFRFPPHSLMAKEIDQYTLLPSVMDSRLGVCLGVSILYLSLAQRLNLTLEAITPPGHIYVRYVSPSGEIVNIETTARGIDVPSDMYLSLETRKLQQRNIKEVVGLAFMNQAALAWHNEDHVSAISLYEKGLEFLPKDPLYQTFLAYQYLFSGEQNKGRKLLKEVVGHIPDHGIAADNVTEDYLAGHASAEALQAIYQEVDETRESILKKQKQIEEILLKHPKFRGGRLHLAVTYLQLGREKEAIPVLEDYMKIDPTNPVVCYYLAALQAQRLNYNAAWKHLQATEKIVHARDHHPKALDDLRNGLLRACPEPR